MNYDKTSQIVSAVGTASGTSTALGYSNAQDPKAASLTEEITMRLEAAISTARDAADRLNAIRDRTFGAQPENMAGANGPSPVPNGKADDISMQFSVLEYQLHRGQSLASELQSRL